MRVHPVVSALLLSGSIFTAALCAQEQLLPGTDSGPTSEPPRPRSFDLSAIDKTADPCVDFYQYACGNWLKHNPIPPTDARWGRFNELGERNLYLLYQELTAAAADPKTPLQRKYGDFYAACMNTELADQLGAKPIEPILAQVDALAAPDKLAELNVALSKRDGYNAFINVGVAQDQKDSSRQILQTFGGGLTLPDRDYYLSQDARSAKIREDYVAHLEKMFALLGDSPETAKTEASSVMRIETALANGTMTRVEQRDPANRYHIMTVAEVQKLTPVYNWETMLQGEGLGEVKTLNVGAPKFLEAVNQQLTAEPLSAIKSYIRWHVLNGAASSLSKPFVDEAFAFSSVLSGQQEQQPRWKRCTRATDGALGEAVGQDWVKKNFPPDAKANMEKLVAALKKALDEDIQTLPWMSDATKKEAELKLAAFRDKVGYPDKWRDYSSLAVKRDDLVGNVQRAAVFERRRNLARLGKPVDETEWGMTPPTVNAYYNPSQNDINFPAGILQPPFYDNSADIAVNYGGIGVVIGHEMTHGFDDQGSKYGPTGSIRYNADGSMGSWFTPDDLKKFNERTKCIADEYSGFKVAEGQNLNGNLTLGENSADNGGIRIAFRALEDTLAKQGITNLDGPADVKDGYTPAQRFFLGFGQVWCENQREQAARVQARTNPHSTGEWRTDGTVQNFDEFGKAFGCKVGQPMMPEKSCRVW